MSMPPLIEYDSIGSLALITRDLDTQAQATTFRADPRKLLNL